MSRNPLENIEIEEDNIKLDIDYKNRLITIQHRYEWLHILNDFLLATWFLIGSIFFFFAHLVTAGTWLFVIGSTQMLIGPVIRIAHKLHTNSIEKTENIHF